MNYIGFYVTCLKESIESGIIDKNDVNVDDYKERIIENVISLLGPKVNRTQVALVIEKRFADILGFE